MVCNDRQLTEAQRQAAYEQLRSAGSIQAIRPFSGKPTPENLVDYINRELYPVLKQARKAVNDVYRPVLDNAPSGNPLFYIFSENTANADPTSGRLRLDNASASAATTIRLSQLNAILSDVAPWLDVMAGSPTAPLGTVTLFHAGDPQRFARYTLVTMIDQGSYWDLTVTAIEASSTTPFADGNAVVLSFIPGVASGGATIPPGSFTGGWGDVLANNAASAGNNPTLTAGDRVIFANTGASPAGGDIDAAGDLTLDSVGDMHLHANGALHLGHTAITDFVHVEAAGEIDIAAGAGVTVTASTTFSEQAGTSWTAVAQAGDAQLQASGVFRLVTGGAERLEVEATGGWQLGGLVGTAGQYMRSAGAGASPAWATISVGELGTIAAETFLGNFTAGAAAPAARAGSSVAGGGLTYTAGGTLAVGAGSGITVNANDVQLSPLSAETFMGNFTAGVAVPAARAGSSVAGGGLTYTAGGTLAVGAGTRITVNADDVQLAAGAAESFLGNFTAGSAVADYRAGSSVAGLGLLYSAGGTLSVGAGSGITVNANDVQLSPLSAETFMGNFTAGVAVPDGRPGSSVAGAGLTYTAGGTLAVGAGSGITVNANDVALTTGVHGDINVVSGTDWQILSQAVGNNELANMAANTIKANPTGATAIAQDVAVSADSVLARVGGNLVSHPWATLAGARLTYAAGVMDVDLGAAYAWTGVHSHTGSSHTIDTTGAVNIDADASSRFLLSAGTLTVGTNTAQARYASAAVIETELLFRISTGSPLVERLEIEADGAWQVNGNTGSAGQVLTSQGNAASPEWQRLGIWNDVITPTALSANQNNYNPTGWGTANVVRLTTNSATDRTITGAAAGSGGEIKYLVHIATNTGRILLSHENASSTAANRFLFASLTVFSIDPHDMVGIWYDGASARWRVIHGLIAT